MPTGVTTDAGGSNLKFKIVNNGVTPTANLIGTIIVNTGEWSHFVFTMNATTRSLYVNGEFDTSDTPDFSAMRHDGDEDLQFGRFDDYYDQYFNGSIDEVMIFNKTLTSEEVASIYNYGN